MHIKKNQNRASFHEHYHFEVCLVTLKSDSYLSTYLSIYPFFFCLRENLNLRYADPQLFAREAVDLSAKDNTTMKDNNCFIPFCLKMLSVNT